MAESTSNFTYLAAGAALGAGLAAIFLRKQQAPAASALPSSKGKRQVSQLTFFGNKLCPFARRAWLVISEMKVPHEYVAIPLTGEINRAKSEGMDALPGWKEGNPDGNTQADGAPHTVDSIVELKEWFNSQVRAAGLGSSATVPTIRVTYADGATAWITEADVVSEFLVDAFDSSFMPTDALAVARVRDVYKALSGSGGVSGMYGALKNMDPALDVEKRDKLYGFLERFATFADPTGPFFSGPTVGWLDLMVAPFYDRFRHCLRHYRGFDLIPSDTTTYPWAARLQKWADAIEEVESFKGITQIPPEAHVRVYQGYGKVRRAFGKDAPASA